MDDCVAEYAFSDSDVVFVEIKHESQWVFHQTETKSSMVKVKGAAGISDEPSYRKYWENSFFRSHPTGERNLPEYSKLIRRVKELIEEDERKMGEELGVSNKFVDKIINAGQENNQLDNNFERTDTQARKRIVKESEKMGDGLLEHSVNSLNEEAVQEEQKSKFISKESEVKVSTSDVQDVNKVESKKLNLASKPKKASKKRKAKNTKKRKVVRKIFKEDTEVKLEGEWNNIDCNEILDISDTSQAIPTQIKVSAKKSVDHAGVKAKISRPSGIKNIGNSCYISSSVQCLKHTKPLWNLINSYGAKKLEGSLPAFPKECDILKSFTELMGRLREDNHSVAPSDFKRVISGHSVQFAGTEQGDAHEFLTFLIDRLNEQLKFAGQFQLDSAFYGAFKSAIQCAQCTLVSESREPFLCISLPIDTDADCISVALHTDSGHLIVVGVEYEDENVTVGAMKECIQKLLIVGPLDVFLLVDNSKLYPIYDYQTIGNITCCKNAWQLYALESSNNPNDLLVKVTITKHIPSFFVRCDREIEGNIVILKDQIKRMLIGNIKSEVDSSKSAAQNLVLTEVSAESIKSEDLEYLSLELKANVKPSHLRQLWSKLPQSEIKLKAQKNAEGAKSYDSLYDCLAKFTGTEKLEGNNQWMCPRCKVNQDANKSIEYLVLPEILMIHLKRFKVIGKKARKKIYSLIRFPVILFLNTTDGRKHMYSLYAIINHIGDIERGHYTAYCRNLKNRNEWLEFDDNKVKSIDASQLITDKAYVLFYEHT